MKKWKCSSTLRKFFQLPSMILVALAVALSVPAFAEEAPVTPDDPAVLICSTPVVEKTAGDPVPMSPCVPGAYCNHTNPNACGFDGQCYLPMKVCVCDGMCTAGIPCDPNNPDDCGFDGTCSMSTNTCVCDP